MPQVPVRSNFNVLPGGPTGRSTRAPTIDGAPPRAPQVATPQFVAGRMTAARANPALVAGVTPEIAAMEGRQLANAGQALQGAAGDAARIVLDIQAQANGLMVDSALNQSKEVAMRLAYDKEAGFTQLRGYDALNRPDGKPLSEEYVGKFDEATAKISETLKNDAQRLAYDQQRAQLRATLEAQTVQHETAQFREYNLSVQEGTIATEIDNIGLNYNNPEIAEQSLTRLKGAVFLQGQALGKSAEWIEAQQKNMTSKAHVTALGAALQDTNIGFADAYIKAHADEMTADDLLKYRGLINKEVDARVALTAAAEVMGIVGPELAGQSDMSRMRAITRQSESGNRERDANGKLITSSAGAEGAMQVMPGTNRDPGFGVVPARDDSDAERTRVGDDYLAAMLRRYGGDAAKAWAAYNAGPGRLDDALAKTKKEGGNWLAAMPLETQKYVTKNIAQLGTGGGSRGKPTLEQAISALDRDPRLAGSPSRMKIARDELEYRFKIAEDTVKTSRDNAREQALLFIDQGGTYATMPPQIRAAIDPDDLDTVQNFAKTKAKGAEIETDMNLYYLLKSDPKALGAANLVSLRDKLGDTEFKELVAQQAKLSQAGGEQAFTQVQTDKQMIDMRLVEMGVDPTPDPNKKAQKDDVAKVGRIWSTYQQRLTAFEANKGAKATDTERGQLIDRMFVEVPVTQGLWGTATKPAALLETGDNVVVPPADRTLITAALQKAKRPVTEQAIVTAYLAKLKGPR